MVLARRPRYRHKTRKKEESSHHRAAKVEPAAEFSAAKFASTFDAIDENSVPASHCLVFW